jgi:hypothetical protein
MMWASFAEGVFVGAALGAVAHPIGKRLPKRRHYTPDPDPEPPKIHNSAVEATAEAVQVFAVTRSRRSRQERKRAAREAERTQRRKLEEWSE